jgi:hypothetical protein
MQTMHRTKEAIERAMQEMRARLDLSQMIYAQRVKKRSMGKSVRLKLRIET